MNSVVLKNGYIDADDLKKKNKSTQKFITTHWVYSKNKFTQKEFYIEPPNINNYQQNMRFNLLKIRQIVIEAFLGVRNDMGYYFTWGVRVCKGSPKKGDFERLSSSRSGPVSRFRSSPRSRSRSKL